MELYHFTAAHLMAGIKREGLTRGVTPFYSCGNIGFLFNHQWLTTNGSFANQSFNPRRLVKYDRCAVRFLIEIPPKYAENILEPEAITKIIAGREINGFYIEPEWRVYKGKIPVKWIKKIDFKPDELLY